MHDIRIEEVGFSTRTYNGLKRNNVNFVSEVMDLLYEDISKFRGLGAKCVDEIIRFQNSFASKLEFEKLEPVDIQNIDLKQKVIYEIFPDLIYVDSFSLKFVTKEGIEEDDYPITLENFSARFVNSLTNKGILTVMDFVYLDINELKNYKNLGTKSINDAIEFLKSHLKYETFTSLQSTLINSAINEITIKFAEDIVLFGEEFSEALKFAVTKMTEQITLESQDIIKNILHDKKVIKQILTSEPIVLWLEYYLKKIIFGLDVISKKRLMNEVPAWSIEYNLVEKALNKLLNEFQIEEVDGKYRKRLPYLNDWINTLKENERKAITLKFQDKTLQECGEVLGVTRERVRQIISKALRKKPILREDDFSYWFKKYNLSFEFCSYVFDMSIQSYSYLDTVYKKGVSNVDDMLQDEKMDGILYPRVKKYIIKDLIFMNDEYIPLNKTKIATKLAKINYSQKDGSFDEFYQEYLAFLKSKNLQELENLMFPSERAFEARMQASPYILMKYGRRFRYYPVNEYDINELIDLIHLDAYKNVEISSKKIMNDYPDVFDIFDIHDEYELHNLLKKTEKEWNGNNKYDLSIQRMPFITFGCADRAKQTEDLLFQIAPVTAEEFGQYYEMEYGVLASTAMTNMGQLINKYYHNGVYSIDQPLFDDCELTYMSDVLIDDLYFLEDVKNIYIKKFGVKTIKKINARTIKGLGYKVYSGYIIRNSYSSADNYFTQLILKDEIIDLNKFDSRIMYIQAFSQVIDELRSKFKILEYEDKKYIRYDRFKKVMPNSNIQDFLTFADRAIEASGIETFFTLSSIKKEDFEDPYEVLGFGDWFSSALIKNSKKIKYQKVGGNILFYKGDMKKTTVDFLRYILEDFISIDATYLVIYLEDRYGIKMDRWKMLSLIKETDMYYSDTMEKVYLTKEEYYDDI